MSLWIVDGSMFHLPVVALVVDWQEGDHIDITSADEDGVWLPGPVRYIKERGTCQVDTTENWLPAERYHRCKHCGAFFAVLDASSDIPPRFCPNCGRKVVDE